MEMSFANKVQAAAKAGWWTLLLAYSLLIVQWLAYLAIMHAKPVWLQTLWGPDLNWVFIQTVWVWAVVALKILFGLLLLLNIWLTLWARNLLKL